MKTESLLDALAPDYLVQLFQETIHASPELPESERERLDQTVWDFVTRNHRPLSTLMGNRIFHGSFPVHARLLFQRAAASALTPEVRALIERQAAIAGISTEEPTLDPPKRKFGPMTRSQAAAFRHLRAMVALHFKSADRGGVRWRTNALLTGPTGVGKSTVVERLADHLGVEFMRCTVSDWIVTGARAEMPTIRAVLKRVRSGQRLLLVIDEIDKLRSFESGWTQSIQADLLNLLDRNIGNSEWTKSDRENLRRNVAMVGCGTWDSIWQKSVVRSVGFGADVGATGKVDLTGRIRKDGTIPREILNRFAEPWLILDPLGVEDFELIARELELPAGLLDPVKAAASGLGYRAVENAITQAALDEILREHDAAAHLSRDDKTAPITSTQLLP